MEFKDIRKHVSGVIHGINQNGLFLSYLFKDETHNIVVALEDLDEFLLESVGEDRETATNNNRGQLCMADALSIAIKTEEERYNRNKARQLLHPIFQGIMDSFTKPIQS